MTFHTSLKTRKTPEWLETRSALFEKSVEGESVKLKVRKRAPILSLQNLKPDEFSLFFSLSREKDEMTSSKTSAANSRSAMIEEEEDVDVEEERFAFRE